SLEGEDTEREGRKGSSGAKGRAEIRATTGSYAVQTPAATVSLGDLLLLRLEKDPFLLLPEDQWFCTTIVVTTPQDQVVLFPCHRWISRGQQVELRGG
ncbi:hypothetical protein CRUP_033527, partial [Coryphaenoides rupestris]